METPDSWADAELAISNSFITIRMPFGYDSPLGLKAWGVGLGSRDSGEEGLLSLVGWKVPIPKKAQIPNIKYLP